MAYSTVDQVKSMFRDFHEGVSPAVTDPEITEFIEEADTVINTALNNSYTIPITGTESLKLMRSLSRKLAAAVVDDILNSYANADDKPTWRDQALEVLKKLIPSRDKDGCITCDPIMTLPDDTYLGTPSSGSTIKLKATTGRQFTKGGDNW